MIKVIILFFISNPLWAATADQLMLYQTPNPEKMTPKQISTESEVYLEKESLIRDVNQQSGVLSDYYYTRKDSGRLSLAYHTSHDYENFSKLYTLDIQVMKKITSYKDQWWGVQLKRVVAQYNALADELESTSTHPDADSQTERRDALQSMTIFGLGVGYRFNILSEFFKTNRVFEQVMAYGNYIYHLDGKNDNKYRGYGATMEYGIHRRVGESFFAGGKLSYNLASLERSKKSDEDKTDRSLVFRWTSIGFEVGYYY